MWACLFLRKFFVISVQKHHNIKIHDEKQKFSNIKSFILATKFWSSDFVISVSITFYYDFQDGCDIYTSSVVGLLRSGALHLNLFSQKKDGF